ncbi:protein FAM78B isoform X1 [Aotus nancymaae]|uniref:protein FAM78B isoform X1 n=1 Tax=Aotus nancymaae TaxID=37293 RepID=UPI0030FE57A1
MIYRTWSRKDRQNLGLDDLMVPLFQLCPACLWTSFRVSLLLPGWSAMARRKLCLLGSRNSSASASLVAGITDGSRKDQQREGRWERRPRGKAMSFGRCSQQPLRRHRCLVSPCPQQADTLQRSSWELPDLREGRVKAISDSDGVSYPWYGNTTETVTLVGPTNKISRFSVSMNDNFYPSVTWAVPVSDSNVPLLTRIKRDQSFTTWLVAMNTTTKEKIILQTIKWRMRVDIEVDPLQLLGQRARLVGRTQQEQPRILSRMEPIPPNALVKPNANDAQVLMWRPKRGPPLVVIPPK